MLPVSAIHAPNFSSIVQLSLSTPPLDGEWRGYPRTMRHSGHNNLILLITSSSSTAFNPTHKPRLSREVTAAPLNSLPLSDCRIIGGPMTVKISSRAIATQLARFLFSGMLKRNLDSSVGSGSHRWASTEYRSNLLDRASPSRAS